MRPRDIHSDDRNMVKKTTRKRWIVIRCRSSSTQNVSQQTCCIDTICCHVPSMIDWIIISKLWDSLSFVALELTQSHVTTMNYLPCEPKTAESFTSHASAATALPGWLTWHSSFHRIGWRWFELMGHRLHQFSTLPGFPTFGPKTDRKNPMLCRLMSEESLSVRKNSSFIWRLDPARTHAGKNGWSMWTTSLLNILKKCLKSAICINKNIFRFKSGKKIREKSTTC